MALIACAECNHQVSDKAFSCPSCGYPIAGGAPSSGGVARVLGGVAGTYISANALVTMVVSVVMFVCFAAIMISIAIFA